MRITRLGIIMVALLVLGGGVTAMTWVKVGCREPQATYRLVDGGNRERTTDCPAGDYIVSEHISKSRNAGKARKCFMLNVREGDCLTVTENEAGSVYARVACTAPLKVTKVVTGKADKNLCATGDTTQVYAEPATTVCISEGKT